MPVAWSGPLNTEQETVWLRRSQAEHVMYIQIGPHFVVCMQMNCHARGNKSLYDLQTMLTLKFSRWKMAVLNGAQ